jgi:hypothetical protein
MPIPLLGYSGRNCYNLIMPTQTNKTKQARRSDATVEPLRATTDPIQAAADCGIDVAQLRDNLALPIAERLRRHQIALNTVELLQKAKRP